MRRFAVGVAVITAGCSGGGGEGGGCPAPVLDTTNERALVLEGGHVEIDAETLTAYEDATLQAWVRLDEAGGVVQIAGKGRPGDAAPAFALYLDDGHPSVGFREGGSFEQSTAVAADITPGEWTHVAIAWNTSSIGFFVDGNVVVNTTTLTGPTTADDAPIFIGGGLASSAVGNSWPGAIDEVRLWAGAHDAGQIFGDYQSMTTGLEVDLLAAWNFEESGRAVADVMPACHSGRVKGSYSRTSDTPF